MIYSLKTESFVRAIPYLSLSFLGNQPGHQSDLILVQPDL